MACEHNAVGCPPLMLIVQKYGGTSVGSIDRMKAVAARALATQRAGHRVVVVVSAMSGETNRLLGLTRQLCDDPGDREVDVVVATGEQVSVGLVALAIKAAGGRSTSLLGHQVKILTDSDFSRARIREIDATAIHTATAAGQIPVVAGFQGIDESGSITTLGRGGSDTTGVALAAALKADVCEIYTDVDGVYTADPNVVPRARKVARISYEAMLELASLGAKVLQIRSVEMGMKYGVPIHVRSSFNDNEGTWVVPEQGDQAMAMEDVTVAGVTATRDEARLTVIGVPDQVGVAAKILAPLAEAGVVVDMIVQNASAEGRTDVTFTLPRGDLKRAVEILSTRCAELTGKGDKISAREGLSKVSVVGVGMRSHAHVGMKMFELLSSAGINILMITTSEIKISVVVEGSRGDEAVRVLHTGFGLDAI
jgi:aspartate kinase